MRECEAEDGGDQDNRRRGAGNLSPAPEPTWPWLAPQRKAAAVVGQLG